MDNRAISAAIKDVFNETRSILEPAGAVAVAGAKAYLKQHNIKVSLGLCGRSDVLRMRKKNRQCCWAFMLGSPIKLKSKPRHADHIRRIYE